jgi:hypothetical protein
MKIFVLNHILYIFQSARKEVLISNGITDKAKVAIELTLTVTCGKGGQEERETVFLLTPCTSDILKLTCNKSCC